jgi:hypothetical protein
MELRHGSKCLLTRTPGQPCRSTVKLVGLFLCVPKRVLAVSAIGAAHQHLLTVQTSSVAYLAHAQNTYFKIQLDSLKQL